MTEFKYLKNGLSLAIDEASCIGCGACIEVCPHGAIELLGRKAAIRDRELCMECGACAKNCPSNSISVSAGVGCAAAIIAGKLRGTAPTCDCGSGGACCG
jgi:NAD-dependent dihydropyrimidine dehydrogenase PreA subunit